MLFTILICILLFKVIIIIIIIGRVEDLNLVNELGCTALHYACYHGEADMIWELAERGADVNVADSSGATPVFYAVSELGSTKAAIGKILQYNPCLFVTAMGFNFEDKSRYVEDSEARAPEYQSEDPISLLEAALWRPLQRQQVAKTLVILGCPYDWDVVKDALDEDFENFLEDFESEPRPLSNLCRLQLRKSLPSGVQFKKALEALKLPSKISSFIKAEGEIEEDEEDDFFIF
jgi:hypothetical protein